MERMERKNHIIVVLVMLPSPEPAATAVWEAQLTQELGEITAPRSLLNQSGLLEKDYGDN